MDVTRMIWFVLYLEGVRQWYGPVFGPFVADFQQSLVLSYLQPSRSTFAPG